MYNSKHEKTVSTYEKGGVANGMTIKYLDAIETTAEYSFFNHGIKEMIYYTGPPLEFVQNMALLNDVMGVSPVSGTTGVPRKDLIFFGLLRNKIPYFGILSYLYVSNVGSYKFKDEGEFSP